MNTELTYEQVLELLPAYALGALEPEEMLAVDAYIQNNPALRDRLHQAESAAAQMAYAAPDAPLPADAKAHLMARVQADLAPQPVELPRPTQRKQAPPPKSPANWLAGLRATLSSATLWAAATGCAVMALIGVILYLNQTQAQLRQVSAQLQSLQNEVSQLQETNQDLQQQLLASGSQLDQANVDLDALKTQMADLQAANTGLQQQVQSDQELLAMIVRFNAERTVQLPGTEEAPDASGTFYLRNDNQGLLVLKGLKPLPTEQTYELWLIPAQGQPEPAGLLAVKTDAFTGLTLSVPHDIQGFAAVGVSVEPAEGSPAPTGPIVLLGKTS